MTEHRPTFFSTEYKATDGYVLYGRHYQCDAPVGVVVIASATGVPQGFYQKFAQFAAANMFDVVTFDYRGIGESAPDNLRGFEMDYRDWARKDLQAVIETVSEFNLPVFLVGHSYGGHSLGLINNHHKVSAAYFMGAGAGWHGWMPKLEGLKVSFMWNVIAPVITRLKGYLGWSALGMGEDLPLGVYKQWKRWCSFPYYFFDDPTQPQMKQQFAEVKTLIKAATATDDKWAMPQSRDAFMQHYSEAELTKVDIEPSSAGLKTIGHMGYFRSASAALWPDVIAFFAEQ